MLKNKLTLLPLLATSAAVMGENEQPNILFCIADDASRESFGAYGGRNCNTPAIDALASEGVVFTNAYTQNPKSAPSRACILTGKYSWQLKEATNHFPHFPAEFTLYPQVLMENGYYVGYTGKGWGPGTYDTKDNPAGPEYNKLTVKDRPAKGIFNTDSRATSGHSSTITKRESLSASGWVVRNRTDSTRRTHGRRTGRASTACMCSLSIRTTR